MRNNTLALALFRAELCRAYALDTAKMRPATCDRPKPAALQRAYPRNRDRGVTAAATELPLPSD